MDAGPWDFIPNRQWAADAWWGTGELKKLALGLWKIYFLDFPQKRKLCWWKFDGREKKNKFLEWKCEKFVPGVWDDWWCEFVFSPVHGGQWMWDRYYDSRKGISGQGYSWLGGFYDDLIRALYIQEGEVYS